MSRYIWKHWTCYTLLCLNCRISLSLCLSVNLHMMNCIENYNFLIRDLFHVRILFRDEIIREIVINDIGDVINPRSIPLKNASSCDLLKINSRKVRKYLSLHEFIFVIWNCFLKTTLINPSQTREEIKRQLEETGVQAVFTYLAKYDDIKICIKDNANIKLPIILMRDGTNPEISITESLAYDEILTDGTNDGTNDEEPLAGKLNYEDTVFLFYTDGITGPPKAVELTHKCVNGLKVPTHETLAYVTGQNF